MISLAASKLRNRKKVAALLPVVLPVVAAMAGVFGVAWPGCASQSTPGQSGAGTWLTILHTNDIHGEYRARPEGDVDGRPEGGGFLALAGVVEGIRRQAASPVVLLDGGDLMAGTPITAIVRQGVRGGGAMEFMNAIGYDAMALGNHEFDLGRDNCLGLIGLAEFPVLSANLVDRESGKLFAPAGDVILERGGVRIAVIGLILDELPLVVAAEPIRDLDVRPGIEVAREEVERLDPQSDLIVVVIHWGLDESRALARAVPGIDVIVTGHDHKRTEKPIVEKGVLIVEAGSRLDRLGRLDLKVADDRVVDRRYELLQLPAAAASEAPAPVAELYHEIESTIDAEYGEVVGKLAVPWVRDSHAESNLGNWVTDRMREAAGADFAVTNSSGLRTDVAAGPLTRREIYSISPFPNVLVTFKATGQQLLAFARKNARDALGMDKSIVQVSGLSYSYDPNGNVYHLMVGGQPVELDRSYLGATTDYLLYSQAKKYLGFVPADPLTDGRSIFDILCESAARMSPISARVEGRMHALDAPPHHGGDCAPESGRGELPPSLLPPLHTLDPAALDRLLADLPDRLPRFDDRLRALALARLGAPYALGTLGEANTDDPDPVFRTDEADCTVLVLTTVALAHARSTEEAERWMGPANYRRQGNSYPVTYKNRLHFTSDRIKSSPLFVDITTEIAEPSERKTAHVVLNRQESGKELLPLDWERELDQTYVPAQKLQSVLDNAPALCGVAFVRLSNIPRGFLVAHEGFLLDGRCLLHASAEAGRVALVDFLDYVLKPRDSDGARQGRPRFDGAIFYALREEASLNP